MLDNVDKIKLPFFYTLGATLNPALTINATQVTWVQMYLWAIRAKPRLEELFRDYPLTVCKNVGAELMAEIDHWDDVGKVTSQAQASQSGGVATLGFADQTHAQQLVNKLQEFEAVLSAELQTLATYQVSQKGIYSTPDLIERAESLFPEEIKRKLPKDAVRDIRESGRCLAFDNATASGFHILRATETVIHAYYVEVCKPTDKKTLDNWGQYVIELKKCPGADVQRIANIIDDLREQERNLIMHPEIFLSPNDAFKLFSVAQGAIITMADKLP